MSPQQHREKDAKVEGRDPPGTAKGTMELFRNLTARLLKVPMSEVREQQKAYERERGSNSFEASGKRAKATPAVSDERSTRRAKTAEP